MKRLSESVKTQADEQLTQRLGLPAFQWRQKTLATYLSFDHEFSIAGLIQAALQIGNVLWCSPVPTHKGGWNLWNTILIFWKKDYAFGLLLGQ